MFLLCLQLQICYRFLNLYPLNGNGTVEIQLDSTAARLGVEKRRMYDIINILEAMQCAVHKRKNTYLWHGGSRLNSFLKMLKKQGENLRLSEALRGRAAKPPAPKHKTLGVLAQRFLMLFLVEPPVSFNNFFLYFKHLSLYTFSYVNNCLSFYFDYNFYICFFQNTLINLEMAVSVLIDSSNKNKSNLSPEQLDRQHKSKVRRLYDIANVFISIGLIEKVSGNLILKKPVFKYVGPFKMKKTDKVVFNTLSPITPLSVLDTQQQMTPCHVFAGKSKRKLEFTTPITDKLGVTTPPHTPSHKWDEILLVADMELNRINNGITV